MASSHSAALAQWQRIEALVQAWLDERQQLIVLLCTLQGHGGFRLAKRHPLTDVRAEKTFPDALEPFGNGQQRRHDHRFRYIRHDRQ